MHHAGLLPKYRLLVERLAQAGLLKIICGTDTLGVGVNVPIRSVLFTQLCKYDGSGVRVLSVREFQQIAGRAGRKGFDDRGDVWAQAPAHVVGNQQAAQQAETDAKKRKKLVKKKPPERGYAHWDEELFDKLVSGDPEPLTSSFDVNHQMVMSLLDRPGDGCAAVRRLMVENHEPRRRQRHHIRRSIAIYRSLVDAGLLEFPETPTNWAGGCASTSTCRTSSRCTSRSRCGRSMRSSTSTVRSRCRDRAPVGTPNDATASIGPAPRRAPSDGAFAGLAEMLGLDDAAADDTAQNDTAQNDAAEDEAIERPVPDGIGTVEMVTVAVATKGDIDRSLAILTIIEAVQESPAVVINAQLRRAKDELMSEMKSAGVEYEERMERLAKVEPPRPLKEWMYADFNNFRMKHPWVGGNTVKPKSIVRDLFERAMTFGEYVQFYGLKQSEGALLRYLSDVYKGLIQNVPVEAEQR